MRSAFDMCRKRNCEEVLLLKVELSSFKVTVLKSLAVKVTVSKILAVYFGFDVENFTA